MKKTRGGKYCPKNHGCTGLAETHQPELFWQNGYCEWKCSRFTSKVLEVKPGIMMSGDCAALAVAASSTTSAKVRRAIEHRKCAPQVDLLVTRSQMAATIGAILSGPQSSLEAK
jgi:hypothetical protein